MSELLLFFVFIGYCNEFTLNYYEHNTVGLDGNYSVGFSFINSNHDIYAFFDDDLYSINYNDTDGLALEFNFIQSLIIQSGINAKYNDVFPKRNNILYAYYNDDTLGTYSIELFNVDTYEITSNELPTWDRLDNVERPCIKIYNSYMLITGTDTMGMF